MNPVRPVLVHEVRGRADDLPEREAVARAVFTTLDALPVGR